MRTFPVPSQNTLIDFIHHNWKLEQVNLTTQQIRNTISRKNVNPYAAGHLRAINLVQQLAADDNTLQYCPNKFQIDTKIAWLKSLHKNIIRPVAENNENTIHPKDIGKFRYQNYSIPTIRGKAQIPEFIKIPELIVKWNNNLIEFQNKYIKNIQYGQYTMEIGGELADKARNASLQLYAIQPFENGNGVLTRLIENMLRLHWGLPWITIDDKKRNTYLDERRNALNNTQL